MKLISNTSFGELCKSKEKEFSRRVEYLDWYEKRRTNFDNFLKQPLNLGMFVPCDDNLNILEEPIFHEPNNENEIGNYEKLIEEYNDAKEKVLFDGFYWEGNYAVCMAEDEMIYIDDEFMHNMTIDKFLTTIITDLQLTENAIKQIGL